MHSIPEGFESASHSFVLAFLFRWLTIILEFLNLPWEDAVLHHEEQINKPGGVRFLKCQTIGMLSLFDMYLPSNQL